MDGMQEAVRVQGVKFLRTEQRYQMPTANQSLTLRFVDHPLTQLNETYMPSCTDDSQKFVILNSTLPENATNFTTIESAVYCAVSNIGFKLLPVEADPYHSRYPIFRFSLGWLQNNRVVKSSVCRVGFACKGASPMLGEDDKSWAFDLLTSEFVHNGQRAALDDFSRVNLLELHNFPMVRVVVLDLLTGDLRLMNSIDRKDVMAAPIVNLREWQNERSRNGDEANEFFPTFCGNGVTANATLLSSSPHLQFKLFDRRHFLDFKTLSSDYKQEPQLTSKLASGLFCIINDDCILSILSFLSIPAHLALRQTCHFARKFYFDTEVHRAISLSYLKFDDFFDYYLMRLVVDIDPECEIGLYGPAPLFVAFASLDKERANIHYQVNVVYPGKTATAHLESVWAENTTLRCKINLTFPSNFPNKPDFEFFDTDVVVFVCYVSSLGFCAISDGFIHSFPKPNGGLTDYSEIASQHAHQL